MSFRTRLSLLFVVIVVVTMVGFGVLAFKLIDDSEAGKADARVGALAGAAAGLYRDAQREAVPLARKAAADPALAKAIGDADPQAAQRAARKLLRTARLARLRITSDGQTLADVGDRRALAPATQVASFSSSGASARVTAATLTPAHLARSIGGDGVEVVVRRGAGSVLLATRPAAADADLPTQGERKIGTTDYRVASFDAPDFGSGNVTVSVLTDRAAAAPKVGSKRNLTLGLLAAFLVVAFIFALGVSRALHVQIQRFLAAARRLAGGDFSTPIAIEGSDEFAELGLEFNTMAAQLEGRLEELRRERARLQGSISRIGQSFASNLDRRALLELGTQTAVDALEADGGRASVRESTGELTEGARAGTLDGATEAIYKAEAQALVARTAADASHGDIHALAAPLGPPEAGQRLAGVLSVARRGEPFDDTERGVLASLAGQAGVSVENVDLHEQVRRQAVTDELTGLSNHRRFQEALAAELERGRRFGHDVGLLMLDVDDFKAVNDAFGHPQGDVVLRGVSKVLRDVSRDVDEPARYGGEELAVILPQTDLEGAYLAGERVREAIEELMIPRVGDGDPLQVTVSLGVASTTAATRQELIAAADRALYEAKHSGKNRTIRGAVESIDVVPGG